MQIHIYFTQGNHLSKSIRKITYKNVKGKYKIILNNLYMLMLFCLLSLHNIPDIMFIWP